MIAFVRRPPASEALASPSVLGLEVARAVGPRWHRQLCGLAEAALESFLKGNFCYHHRKKEK